MGGTRSTLQFAILTAAILAFALPAPALGAPQPLDDQDIARAIDNQFFIDPAIDANRIRVQVNDGIAELTGTVRNVLARDRSTEIAELVKGVRAVSNRIEVKPSPIRMDGDVRKDIELALARDPATDSYEVSVAVEENVATLTGTVQSWAEKQLSEKVAKGVKGVVGVENQIRIAQAAQRPDSEIRTEIQRRLHWDALVDGYLIDVEVADGKVRLSGTVGSASEKRQAQTDSWTAGVKSVDASGLKVQWWADDEDLRKEKYAARSDDEIEKAIADAALYDPRVASFRIEPHASNGWVTLRGTVDNLEARKAATQLARNTVGVFGVSNQLKVSGKSTPGDSAIGSQVEAALAVNPITESFEIGVEVEDGRVTLTGTVDSFLEKFEAEDEAAKVTGVTQVRNRLDVADAVSYVLPYHHYPWTVYPAPIMVTPSPPTASDHTIRQRIDRELAWSPFVDANEVEVDVENGVATLEGTVDSWREYHAAADNAFEGGAVSVHNRLEVEN